MSLWLYGLQLVFTGIGLLIGLCIMLCLITLVIPFLWALDRMIS